MSTPAGTPTPRANRVTVKEWCSCATMNFPKCALCDENRKVDRTDWEATTLKLERELSEANAMLTEARQRFDKCYDELTALRTVHEAAQSKLSALSEAHNNLRADYTKVRSECDGLRKDADRLTFFMDQSGQFYEEGYNYFVTGALQEYIDAARKP